VLELLELLEVVPCSMHWLFEHTSFPPQTPQSRTSPQPSSIAPH
jgi:hypothetical protein